MFSNINKYKTKKSFKVVIYKLQYGNRFNIVLIK